MLFKWYTIFIDIKIFFNKYIRLDQSLIAFTCFLPWSSIVFVCFSKAFTNGEYVNLDYSITLLWFEGSISLTVRNSYLSIFPDNNADIFVASMLISYCNFPSLILSSIVMIGFYISERLFLKRKGLSDAKVLSITKKNMVLRYIFY